MAAKAALPSFFLILCLLLILAISKGSRHDYSEDGYQEDYNVDDEDEYYNDEYHMYAIDHDSDYDYHKNSQNFKDYSIDENGHYNDAHDTFVDDPYDYHEDNHQSNQHIEDIDDRLYREQEEKRKKENAAKIKKAKDIIKNKSKKNQAGKNGSPADPKQTAEVNANNRESHHTVIKAEQKLGGQNDVHIKMSEVSDPDPHTDAILKSQAFNRIRKEQITDYIKGHFSGQKLQDDVLGDIDNLITSNLKKELKTPDSRLNRMLVEQGISIASSGELIANTSGHTPHISTQAVVDSSPESLKQQEQHTKTDTQKEGNTVFEDTQATTTKLDMGSNIQPSLTAGNMFQGDTTEKAVDSSPNHNGEQEEKIIDSDISKHYDEANKKDENNMETKTPEHEQEHDKNKEPSLQTDNDISNKKEIILQLDQKPKDGLERQKNYPSPQVEKTLDQVDDNKTFSIHKEKDRDVRHLDDTRSSQHLQQQQHQYMVEQEQEKQQRELQEQEQEKRRQQEEQQLKQQEQEQKKRQQLEEQQRELQEQEQEKRRQQEEQQLKQQEQEQKKRQQLEEQQRELQEQEQEKRRQQEEQQLKQQEQEQKKRQQLEKQQGELQEQEQEKRRQQEEQQRELQEQGKKHEQQASHKNEIKTLSTKSHEKDVVAEKYNEKEESQFQKIHTNEMNEVAVEDVKPSATLSGDRKSNEENNYQTQIIEPKIDSSNAEKKSDLELLASKTNTIISGEANIHTLITSDNAQIENARIDDSASSSEQQQQDTHGVATEKQKDNGHKHKHKNLLKQALKSIHTHQHQHDHEHMDQHHHHDRLDGDSYHQHSHDHSHDGHNNLEGRQKSASKQHKVAEPDHSTRNEVSITDTPEYPEIITDTNAVNVDDQVKFEPSSTSDTTTIEENENPNKQIEQGDRQEHEVKDGDHNEDRRDNENDVDSTSGKNEGDINANVDQATIETAVNEKSEAKEEESSEKVSDSGFLGGFFSFFSSGESSDETDAEKQGINSEIDPASQVPTVVKDLQSEERLLEENLNRLNEAAATPPSFENINNEQDISHAVDKQPPHTTTAQMREEPDVSNPTEEDTLKTVDVKQTSSLEEPPYFKESVDMEHEKAKYTEDGQNKNDFKEENVLIPTRSFSTKPSVFVETEVPPVSAKASETVESLSDTSTEDPLYKLCQSHPTLQACKRTSKSVGDKRSDGEEHTKQTSAAGYIKIFTRWMNGWIYSGYFNVISCLKSVVIVIWSYSIATFLNLIGQHEIARSQLNYLETTGVEKFAVVLVFIVNHIVFYWYFKNSTMGPSVRIVNRADESILGPVVDDSRIEELEEKVIALEKQLNVEKKNTVEMERKTQILQDENKKLSSEVTELLDKVKDVESDKLTIASLRQQTDEYKGNLETKETQLRISNTTLDSTKEDLNTMKSDYKELETKFFYVIKELDTKDVKISKMEEKEKNLNKLLEDKQGLITERDESLNELNTRIDLLLEEKIELEDSIKENEKHCNEYKLEIQVLQEALLSVNKVAVDHETSSEFDNVEEDQEIDAEQLKAERLAKIMDATKAQAELLEVKKELVLCNEELARYTELAVNNDIKYNDIWYKYEEISTESTETRKELEKKEIELSTIRKFFGDRENDFQKQSAHQAEENKRLKKQIDSIGDNDKQISILLKQVEELKEEIETNEKQLKQQIATAEEQSHNNYIKMRTAIRECDEHKREKEIYRKRLLDIDMSPAFKTTSPSLAKSVPSGSSQTHFDRSSSPSGSNKSTDDSRTDSPARPHIPPGPPPPFGPRMYSGMPPPFMTRPPLFGTPPLRPPFGAPRPPYMSPFSQTRLPPGPPSVAMVPPVATSNFNQPPQNEQRLIGTMSHPPPSSTMYGIQPPITPPYTRPTLPPNNLNSTQQHQHLPQYATNGATNVNNKSGQGNAQV